jgi:hypothetical protein
MDKSIDELKNKPTGGFPALYVCNKIDTKKKDDTKARGFTADERDMLVDIKSILTKTDDAPKPFIPM